MDVTSPQLIWIGGRCYRVNPTHDDDGNNQQLKGHETTSTPYCEDDLYDEDADEDDNYDIFPTKNNHFKTLYHVPQVFYSQIIGSKGMTKRRIEAETKTQVTIPKQGVIGKVTIIGSTRQSVRSARRKIDLIVLAARNKQQFTHFLCVPFKCEEIIKNFRKFKESILFNETISPNFDASLFQSHFKLHLTITTLSLMDEEDRVIAAETLQECKDAVIEPILEEFGQINIILKGLEYMNDDPSAVDVLYGKIESEPLQLMVDCIAERFALKGLTQRKTDKIKLHVTLINSLFREEYDPNNPLLKNRQTFDARKILETYKDYEFGSQPLTEIHLSQRYSTANDGFYEATGTLLI